MEISLFDAVFVVFLILKLLGLVSWSWWIVFSPIIIGIAFYALIAAIAVVIEIFK